MMPKVLNLFDHTTLRFRLRVAWWIIWHRGYIAIPMVDATGKFIGSYPKPATAENRHEALTESSQAPAAPTHPAATQPQGNA